MAGEVMNKLVYVQSLKAIRDSVPPAQRRLFDLQYGGREKDPPAALALSLALGTIGVDRFYLGHVVLGILKLVTFGGFFLWTIIDWFAIMGSARNTNLATANEVRQYLG